MFPMRTFGGATSEALRMCPLAVRIANIQRGSMTTPDTTSRAVMGARDGVVIWCAEDAPDWVTRVRDKLFP